MSKQKNAAAVLLGQRSQELTRKRLGEREYKKRMSEISMKRKNIEIERYNSGKIDVL